MQESKEMQETKTKRKQQSNKNISTRHADTETSMQASKEQEFEQFKRQEYKQDSCDNVGK